MSNVQRVSDVSTGYEQTLNGIYFKGQTNDIAVSNGLNGYALISNPANSGINFFLDDAMAVNFSGANVRLNVYFCPSYVNNLIRSNNIVNSNSYYCNCPNSKTEIYYGNSMQIISGIRAISLSIPAYSNVIGFQGGNSIISPGSAHIIELISLNPVETAQVVISYGWWESSTC